MIIVDDPANVKGMYHGDDKEHARRVGERHGHQWSHLSSTPDDVDFSELHAFAVTLGLRRSWFQSDHYDIVPTKLALALKHGATLISRQEMSMVLIYDRKGRERPSYGQLTP